MYRKGFTLIEMAVVIVVIGLILGMALKATDMIQTAKIRSEVTKITKISAAIGSYYGKYGIMPGSDPIHIDARYADLVVEDLDTEGFLTLNDFLIGIKHKDRTDTHYYALTSCTTFAESSGYIRCVYQTGAICSINPALPNLYRIDSVCVVPHTSVQGLTTNRSTDTYADIACIFEGGLDDGDPEAGNAQYWFSGNNENDVLLGIESPSECRQLNLDGVALEGLIIFRH